MTDSPKRLVLEVPPTRQITTRDFRLFNEALIKEGVEDGTDVSVEICASGSIKFYAALPVKPQPKKSRQAQAVENQLASRREAIKRGDDVPGYVPPVKPRRTVKIPRQRKVTSKKSAASKAREDGSKK